MGNSSVILYALECEHAAPAAPTLVNGKLDCAWCNERKAIAGVIVYEWRARCASCTFARWTGLSKYNALLWIARHMANNPEHKGYAEYTKNPEAVKTEEKFRAWTRA